MIIAGRKPRHGIKPFAILLLSPVLIACDSAETNTTSDSLSGAPCSNISQIYGDWDVSLVFDLNQPPSSTTISIDGDDNTAITGSFYDTPFSSAQITAVEGQYILAAATADNSGEYIHMARYDCQTHAYEGQAWSRGRNFVMSWTAQRQWIRVYR